MRYLHTILLCLLGSGVLAMRQSTSQAFPFEHELVPEWEATGGCTLNGWSGRYMSGKEHVLRIDVTKTHFIAEFFPESFPEFMEPQLHQLFNQLHGRRSREDAAELLCKLDGAEAACKAWSATAVLCPEVNEALDPWSHELAPGWLAGSKNGCTFGGWSGRYTVNGQPVLKVDVGLSTTSIKILADSDADMEVLQKVNGTHPNDLVRETFCTLRESAWDYLILDRACHLWSYRWCGGAKEVEDPWKHELASGWVADSGNGCKEGHWLGRYNINDDTVLSVDVGLTTSTVQFFPVEASMAKEEEDLLQKVNGTKFNDELAEILCDLRRSNPWNIETLDKACYLWSQTRCGLCPDQS